MGLFSLILLLVPFAIGAVALLLERVEARLDSDEKLAVADVAAEVAATPSPEEGDAPLDDGGASPTSADNSTD